MAKESSSIELLAWGRGIYCGVFEDPGVLVEEEDRMEAGGEGGVDVAFGAVADHPTGVGRELVAGDDLAVGRGVFFLDDFNGGEVAGEAGAGELVGLLGVVALGHEDETVAGGQLGEGFGDAGEQLDLLLGDGAGEAANALDFFFGDRARG